MDYLDINLNFEERYLWKENKKLFELLRLDNNYTNVIFDERSGGVSATHILHSKSNCKEEIVLNGKTGKQLEEECQKVIRQKGGSCILESEKLQQNGLFLVSLDATINGERMDIASITKSGSSVVFNTLTRKEKQTVKYNEGD